MRDFNKKLIAFALIFTAGVFIMKTITNWQEEEKIRKYIEEMRKRRERKEKPPEDLDYELLWQKIGEKASKVGEELVKKGKIPYALRLYVALQKRADLDIKRKCWVYLQARHETAGFTKFAGKFNYWGIKFPKEDKILQVKYEEMGVKPSLALTWEIIKGKSVRVWDTFCSFPNADTALHVYLNYVSPSKKALAEAETLKDFAALLKFYGYYTDEFEKYLAGLERGVRDILA